MVQLDQEQRYALQKQKDWWAQTVFTPSNNTLQFSYVFTVLHRALLAPAWKLIEKSKEGKYFRAFGWGLLAIIPTIFAGIFRLITTPLELLTLLFACFPGKKRHSDPVWELHQHLRKSRIITAKDFMIMVANSNITADHIAKTLLTLDEIGIMPSKAQIEEILKNREFREAINIVFNRKFINKLNLPNKQPAELLNEIAKPFIYNKISALSDLGKIIPEMVNSLLRAVGIRDDIHKKEMFKEPEEMMLHKIPPLCVESGVYAQEFVNLISKYDKSKYDKGIPEGDRNDFFQSLFDLVIMLKIDDIPFIDSLNDLNFETLQALVPAFKAIQALKLVSSDKKDHDALNRILLERLIANPKEFLEMIRAFSRLDIELDITNLHEILHVIFIREDDSRIGNNSKSWSLLIVLFTQLYRYGITLNDEQKQMLVALVPEQLTCLGSACEILYAAYDPHKHYNVHGDREEFKNDVIVLLEMLPNNDLKSIEFAKFCARRSPLYVELDLHTRRIVANYIANDDFYKEDMDALLFAIKTFHDEGVVLTKEILSVLLKTDDANHLKKLAVLFASDLCDDNKHKLSDVACDFFLRNTDSIQGAITRLERAGLLKTDFVNLSMQEKFKDDDDQSLDFLGIAKFVGVVEDVAPGLLSAFYCARSDQPGHVYLITLFSVLKSLENYDLLKTEYVERVIQKHKDNKWVVPKNSNDLKIIETRARCLQIISSKQKSLFGNYNDYLFLLNDVNDLTLLDKICNDDDFTGKLRVFKILKMLGWDARNIEDLMARQGQNFQLPFTAQALQLLYDKRILTNHSQQQYLENLALRTDSIKALNNLRDCKTAAQMIDLLAAARFSEAHVDLMMRNLPKYRYLIDALEILKESPRSNHSQLHQCLLEIADKNHEDESGLTEQDLANTLVCRYNNLVHTSKDEVSDEQVADIAAQLYSQSAQSSPSESSSGLQVSKPEPLASAQEHSCRHDNLVHTSEHSEDEVSDEPVANIAAQSYSQSAQSSPSESSSGLQVSKPEPLASAQKPFIVSAKSSPRCSTRPGKPPPPASPPPANAQPRSVGKYVTQPEQGNSSRSLRFLWGIKRKRPILRLSGLQAPQTPENKPGSGSPKPI